MLPSTGKIPDWISRDAAAVRVVPEGIRLTNLSSTHDLLVRPWGASGDSDFRLLPLPLAAGDTRLRERSAVLVPGNYLLRNGRSYKEGEPCTDPSDRESCWVYINIPTRSVDFGLGKGDLSDPGRTTDPDISQSRAFASPGTPPVIADLVTESSLQSLVWQFVEFLHLPPRVHPRARTTAEMAAAGAPAWQAQRKSDALKAARANGFQGNGDEALLRWCLATKMLTPRRVLGWRRLGIDFGIDAI